MEVEGTRVRVLGRGSYGVVHLVQTWSPVSELFAVKSADERHSSSLLKEEEILGNLDGCPNIVRCFGGLDGVEDDGTKVFNLFLEYAPGGCLLDMMKKYGGRIPERDVKCFARMILQGLVDVHQRGYVHSDLKPENILVFPNSEDHQLKSLKIADFGLAKQEGVRDTGFWEHGFLGTPHYMSPESIVGEISSALDVWSFGCIVLEMVTGQLPWPDHDLKVLSDKLLRGEIPYIPKYMSRIGENFLMKCFNLDPKERWTASMLLNHPYLLSKKTKSRFSKSFLEYWSS